MTNQQLLDNRLQFITHHRDWLEKLPGLHLYHSHRSFFKVAYLFDKMAIGNVPENFSLHVPDWLGISDQFLEKHSWKYSEAMNYMHLSGDADHWSCNPDVIIKQAKDDKTIRQLCRIQSQGFNEADWETSEWYPALLESSLKNYREIHHGFHAAYLGTEQIGVTVTYQNNETVGLYSVTTLAKYRKMGVSTTLMKAIIEQAKSQGIDLVTLQVMGGSYAEGFYKKLGFEHAFACRIFTKKE